MQLLILITTSLFLLLAFGEAQDIRVLLAETERSVVVALPEAHQGLLDGQLAFTTPFALDWPFEAKEGTLLLEGEPIGQVVELMPLGPQPLLWQGRPFRGSIELAADGSTIRVINIVPLEDYLRGVVPAEMPAFWPAEALKAQAVAARTYVLAARDPELAYDVCATVMCQVYHGAAAEDPRSDTAIADTAGLVLTYDGTVARTHYHSHSGGHLASSLEVWGRALPYLEGHADVASPPPHDRWEFRLNPAQIAASLATQGKSVGQVRALSVLAQSPSGRAAAMKFSGDRGEVVLEGPELTRLLRSWGLKSTRFTLRDGLVVQGGGYGHGVGMSQYGAYTLALNGRNYEDILRFYYPGTELESLGPQPTFNARHP